MPLRHGFSQAPKLNSSFFFKETRENSFTVWPPSRMSTLSFSTIHHHSYFFFFMSIQPFFFYFSFFIILLFFCWFSWCSYFQLPNCNFIPRNEPSESLVHLFYGVSSWTFENPLKTLKVYKNLLVLVLFRGSPKKPFEFIII